jgi:hypothetical protein
LAHKSNSENTLTWLTAPKKDIWRIYKEYLLEAHGLDDPWDVDKLFYVRRAHGYALHEIPKSLALQYVSFIPTDNPFRPAPTKWVEPPIHLIPRKGAIEPVASSSQSSTSDSLELESTDDDEGVIYVDEPECSDAQFEADMEKAIREEMECEEEVR